MINAMANEHPFQMLFDTLGRLPGAHAESVNRQAYEILYDILSVPVEKPGRCILLRAPRAGHGKTHLLSRIQHHLGASHEFIPLHAAFGCQIDAATVIDDALRRLLRPLPASGGLCVLDLVTRRLFAAALQPLVGSGEVPCQDREGALAALRTRPIETFDFHHPNAVTAHWARENFEVLGQRLSVELAQRCDLQIREVAFWVDALFRFAATPVENPLRLRVLADVVHAGIPGDGVLMERLEALLGMLAQLMRVVLVADDLEGFSTDETAALRLAAFLGALRQSVERLDVILSLNQDIWQSAFVPRLSNGLADRLSEVVIELKPLTEEEMVALLESRVPGLGTRVFDRVDRVSAGSHARGLLRAAGVAWLRASAMDSTAVPAPVPVAAPVRPEVAASAFIEPVQVENIPEIVPDRVAPAAPPAPEPAPARPVAVERTPDPTLAIGFLKESASQPVQADSWASPEVSPSPPAEISPPPRVPEVFPDSPSQPQTPVAEVSPAAVSPPPPSLETTLPEPSGWPAPVETPFQASFAPDPPVSTREIQPAPEPPVASVFEAVPEPAPAPVFEAVPEPDAARAFQPAASPPPATAPDTDRVDDLLRQFRERYGRGN